MLFSSTNTWKSFDSIGEEYFVGSSVQADTLTKKSTEELTNKDIYVKQPEGNVQCTLYSTVMMLRRDAILDGDTNWKTSFTSTSTGIAEDLKYYSSTTTTPVRENSYDNGGRTYDR